MKYKLTVPVVGTLEVMVETDEPIRSSHDAAELARPHLPDLTWLSLDLKAHPKINHNGISRVEHNEASWEEV